MITNRSRGFQDLIATYRHAVTIPGDELTSRMLGNNLTFDETGGYKLLFTVALELAGESGSVAVFICLADLAESRKL